ncbi:DMT family transporter [Cellulomonas citrea]|uniref:DMT family transporter n=1 Tax=Cellulomonas citrea TaxID=1909423 RepID=UPI00135ADFAD|nr:DMT family transporter [Cellulomonas citrea]
MLVAALLGVLVGALIPVQTSVNTRLSRAIGATLPASLVSFAVGTVGLGALVLVTRAPLPLAATAAAQPWWIWVGGLCGAVFLTLNIVLMPRVGASATVLLPVVGQVVGGLVIDLTGAFGVAERALTVPRLAGTALVVVGAVAVNLGRSAPGAPSPRGAAMAVLGLLGVVGGVLGAVQTTVNGRLGAVLASPLSAALVSFTVGTLCLVVVNLAGRQRVHRPVGARWWTWTGGFLGAAFVTVNALAAPVLGTSLTVSIVLLGQIVSGLVLDHRGFLGATRRPVSVRRVAGALLVLLGVAIVRLWG